MQQRAMNHLINTKTINDEMALFTPLVVSVHWTTIWQPEPFTHQIFSFFGGGVSILDLNLVAKVCTQILNLVAKLCLKSLERVMRKVSCRYKRNS